MKARYRSVVAINFSVFLFMLGVGLIVALLGQTHPIGIFFAAIFLGGVRLGSLGGLMFAGVPRELGGAMIATMVLFMAAEKAYWPLLERVLKKKANHKGTNINKKSTKE